MHENNVNTGNLVIGDCFKNYKELCVALNQPTYGGNQKKKQLEDFKRYFEYEKTGNKFYILDIYKNPKEKEHSYPHNSIYVQHIEIILLNFLSKQKGYQVDIPSQYLWLELGMINKDFIDMQYKKEELLEMHKQMRMFYIRDFYQRCRLKFIQIVDSALNSLCNQKLIVSTKIHKVKYPNSFYAETETLIEKVFILKAERETLDELGFKSVNEVYIHNKSKEYYAKRNEKLKKTLGCVEVYDCLNIVFDPERAKVEVEKYKNIDNDKIKSEKKDLNKKVISSIDKQAERIQNNKGINNKEVKEKIDSAKETGEKAPFYYYESYLDMQYLLSDTLLKIE